MIGVKNLSLLSLNYLVLNKFAHQKETMMQLLRLKRHVADNQPIEISVQTINDLVNPYTSIGFPAIFRDWGDEETDGSGGNPVYDPLKVYFYIYPENAHEPGAIFNADFRSELWDAFSPDTCSYEIAKNMISELRKLADNLEERNEEAKKENDDALR